MSKISLYLFCIVFVAASCDFREREQALQKREAAVYEKEQQLLVREKTVALKEAELLQKIKGTDSTHTTDTTHTINTALTGNWRVKMTCTETSCTGSAIGDIRNERWGLEYQGNLLVAKATADEKLIRVYSGFYTGNTIELAEDRNSTVAPSSAKMVVRLRLVDSTNLEGEREIVRDNNCKIVYAMQMEKITE